jgi:hypothetical protein
MMSLDINSPVKDLAIRTRKFGMSINLAIGEPFPLSILFDKNEIRFYVHCVTRCRDKGCKIWRGTIACDGAFAYSVDKHLHTRRPRNN